jgi:hypothetical protein
MLRLRSRRTRALTRSSSPHSCLALPISLRRILSCLLTCHLLCVAASAQNAPALQPTATPAHFEYLWYEAENMQGLARDARNEPVLNPSWLDRTAKEAPGWGINGPGVSAEWSQGGESEWNSVAASADETHAAIYQDIVLPRDGQYKIWVRYADWARRTEYFTVRLTEGGRELFRREFGAHDRVDPHDEVSMYWQWAFTWDATPGIQLKRGPARLSIEIERAADARRHVDCVLVTNDLAYTPTGREKPTFAAARVLRDWSEKRPTLESLLGGVPKDETVVPALWRRPLVAGRDFLMPWNINEKFWELYDKTPPDERPLYPFSDESVDAFIEKYKGARDVPLFSSKLVVPVIYINNLPTHLKEGSPFLRYLRETHAPFAVLINFGAANFSEADGQAAWKLLSGELHDQFLGWISGESVGHVWPDVASRLTLAPDTPRREMLESYHNAYTSALERKWSGTFHTPTGPMWDKLIVAQSTSSTAYAHALGAWGERMLGMETASVMPNWAMRVAFTRGAARQFGGSFLYYHAPNFGDTATTFTHQQNFAGPDFFYHTRYGPTMGPSLAWYRKSYYFYYMAGASAIYLEEGFDQFFKPGPGEHPYQLNPLGRITDEFMRFAEKHPARGTPYTPIAFLLDSAHGWDMTDYPQLPFGVSPVGRSDRALRELFSAAYYPVPVVEGEPATADRQAFVNGIFGDIFDVLVAADERRDAIDAYRAVVGGGRIAWTPAWAAKLRDYVHRGGTVVLNAAQAQGLPEDLLGVHLQGAQGEADDARCLLPNEAASDLSGQMFRFERTELRGAQVLMQTPAGEPLVTRNRVGQGQVIFCAIPDLLGLDERLTTVAAHLFAHLFADAAPVRVAGDVQYLVNRTEQGWVVTLINNRGVYKPQQGLAQVNRTETADVRVDLRGKSIERANEWTEDEALQVEHDGGADTVRLQIPAGGVRVVELLPRK